jgi:hypothetical protein
MNRREGPSTTELEKRMEKRLNLAQPPKYDKRFNRSGVNGILVSSDGSPDSHGNADAEG